jgi:squalene cyclase
MNVAANFRPTAPKWTELTSEAIEQLARGARPLPTRNIRNAINFLLKRPMR